MLAYPNHYAEQRTPSPSALPSKNRVKKDKIKLVSKASLAVFDPRLAMGIDTTQQWNYSSAQAYHTRHSFDDDHRAPANHANDFTWRADPTPELEAFSRSEASHGLRQTSMDEHHQITRQISASSIDEGEQSSRRRFLSRKTNASPSGRSDDSLVSPSSISSPQYGIPASSSASSTSSSSSLARFFAWKKKEKQPSLTTNVFECSPQSAPPSVTSFDRSHDFMQRRRKDSDSSSVDSTPSSLPTSPVRTPTRAPQNSSPSRTSPLGNKKSMPAMRQMRELQSTQSIRFDDRTKFRYATEAPPSLPPFPTFEAPSPIIPLEYSWSIKTGTSRDSPKPSTARPVSRFVSSTGRGVPSPGLDPQRGYDSRKSVITMRNDRTVVFDESKSKAMRRARNAEKRMSMAQKVVDGVLPRNHGREEPEMRSERSGMQVKTHRRRSRSVDGHAAFVNNVTSPPSSNSHSDSVFPAFVRHAPQSAPRSASPSSPFRAEVDSTKRGTPSPQRGPQRSASGETHQVRRVNVSGQRARAVGVASPLLIAKSPRMGAGPPTMPLPVVNVMPPTPDLGVEAEFQGQKQQSAEEQDKLEQQKQEQLKLEQQKLEQQKLEQQRLEQDKLEQQKLKQEKLEQLRLEQQKLEQQRLNQLKLEQQRLNQLKLEQQKLEQQKLEQEKLEQQKLAQEKLELQKQQQLEQQRRVQEARLRQDAAKKSGPAPFSTAPLSPVKKVPAAQRAALVRPPSPKKVLSAVPSRLVAAPASPESVYSPCSVYSPDVTNGRFSTAYAGVLPVKEEIETMTESISDAELENIRLPRTDSMASELSDISSSGSSSSGAFAFSRSMSNSSMVSGGTYSSASSAVSDSPDCHMRKMSSLASLNFSPSDMTSSSSLASTVATSASVLDFGIKEVAPSPSTEYSNVMQQKLKMPFELQPSADRRPSLVDDSDCKTPTLASFRELSPQEKASEAPSTGRKLGLDMDLSDLALELGLGRLSQIGLGHLKCVQELKEVDKPQVRRKEFPAKPPKSSARALARAPANDIASSAAIAPLPISIAGRSPQTPPRHVAKQAAGDDLGSATKVSAKGVPKAPGGVGLGLNFAESPSPTKPRYPRRPVATAEPDGDWFGVAM